MPLPGNSGTVVDSSTPTTTMSEQSTAPPPVRSRSVKFSLASGNRPNNGTGNGVDESATATDEQAERGSDGLSRRRFKVARVATVDIPGDCDDDEDFTCNNVSCDLDDDSEAAIGDLVSRTLSTSKGGHVTSSGPDHYRRAPSGDDEATHEYDTYWETTVQKTFGHNTLETLPHADHYRNILSATGQNRLDGRRQRPTLMELHEQDAQEEMEQMIQRDEVENDGFTIEEVKPLPVATKMGWIQGVLVRCLLNIFGVMLFLRLSWVVGQAGLGLATLIILLASLVTTLTALSMSTICTNGEVKGGGAYYMISRCLGPEFGGAIGVIFSLANTVAAAMYIVGFAETIRDILKDHNCLMVDEINDVRIIGVITAVAMLLVAFAGLSWESKTQLVLLAILTAAILNFAVGTLIPKSEEEIDKGVQGYSASILMQNFLPEFRNGHSFFSVFAIFFPAATGILAGANISGDLKDPQGAIPKGTLLAILITTMTYLAMAWMAGSCVLRDAGSTIISTAVSTAAFSISNTTDTSVDAFNAPFTYGFSNEQVTDGAPLFNFTSSSSLTTALVRTAMAAAAAVADGGFGVGYYGNDEVNTEGVATSSEYNVTNGERRIPCIPGLTCKYGIQNDMQVMQLVSVFGPITIAGIISATLSSALASIVSAPRVFQAVCRDNIFPYIKFFGKGYGAAEEPRRAYLLSFFIAVACVAIGELNIIAPLISNFFLISYALINYSCVDASLAKSPGWRPSFRYYSMWLSLLGAVLCVAVMFVINWWTALLTIALVVILYCYVHYRKPDINWGSSTQAHVYRGALQQTQKLTNVLEHVKNFRPQVLAMTGFPSDRPALVDFVSSISRNVSLMVCGQVLLGDPLEKLQDAQLLSRMAYSWLSKRKVKSFFTAVTARDLRQGMQSMMQCTGVGKLRPNTLMMGFKSDWQVAPPQSVIDYVNTIHDASFDLRYGVGILCLKERLYNPTNLSPFVATDPPSGRTSNCRPASLGMTGASLTASAADITSPTSFTTLSTDIVPGSQSEDANRLACRINGVSDAGSGPATAVTAAAIDGSVKLNIADDIDCWDRRSNDSDDDDDEEDEDDKLTKTPSMPELDAIDVDRFHHRQKKGFIDVWWLFDDGGLSLLIPYIMTTKKLWQNCKLRVFTARGRSTELSQDKARMEFLMNKFRIEFSSLTVIPDIAKRPHPDRISEFDATISDWTLNTELQETPESHPWKITEKQLTDLKDEIWRQAAGALSMKPGNHTTLSPHANAMILSSSGNLYEYCPYKTFRYIRLRELLQEYSSDATLIVMTLPVLRRKGHRSVGLYMAWLDTLSRDMPPMLLLRGNQESVLTYYS